MRAWKPDTTAVAAKIIDGEAIIMNLTNGAYYSMNGVGALIWEGIEQAQGGDAIVERIASRCGADRVRVRADFDRLVGELLTEGLIVETVAEVVSVVPEAGSANDTAYAPPALNKYTEMADLLALDPPMPALEEISGNPPRAG
jgi:hypothetical protein